MRPGQVHWVATTEDSAVYGRHFFAAKTMKDSILALVHAYFMDNLITNAEHDHAKVLVFRLMASWLAVFRVSGSRGESPSIKQSDSTSYLDS